MRYIFCIFFILISLCSCEDFFEQTLEIDPPEHTDQLAISAFFNTNQSDTSLRVLVVRSTAILDNTDRSSREIEGASIELFSEDQLLAVIPETEIERSGYNYQLSPSPVTFEEGKAYMLRVNHPDYEEATATIVVPQKIVPFAIELEEDGGVDEFGERVDRVTVEFNDPPEEENYYEIALFSIVTFNDGQGQYLQEHYINSLDFNLEESFFGARLLPDQSFNGKEYKVLLDFNRFDEENTTQETFLIWRSVTRDYYQFARSVRQQGDAEDNFGPFAEPVTIKANFEGGLGLFSINVENIYPL